MHPRIERQVRAALPPLRIGWGIMVAASGVWTGLGVLASPVASPPGGSTATPLTTAIVVLGVLSAAGTVWLDRAILTPGRIAASLPLPDHALSRRHLLVGHLALWSLAVLPAILGLAQLLLDGPLRTHLALCAASLALLALLMPTQARVAARLEAMLR